MRVDHQCIIFCDESERKGKYCSNFYGGVLVSAKDFDAVTARLEAKKRELNFYGEVKWDKVSAPPYQDKYEQLIRAFFDEVRAGRVKVRAGRVKVRIMFRQNARQPVRLTREQQDNEYFLFYYQFLKHAFGLLQLPPRPPRQHGTRLRLYFDEFPETREKASQFKGYLLGLQSIPALRDARVSIAPEDIAEVDSRDHVLLQCLDIVMGAMAFRLNFKHREKPPGKRLRGRKTRAKERIYKRIHAEICTLRPRFNIGSSTGLTNGDRMCRWNDPYRHWNFIATNAEVDSSAFKPKRKKRAT